MTATHSLTSSPCGRATATRRLPLPSVACASLCSWYSDVPSAIFLFGLNVLVDLLEQARSANTRMNEWMGE